MALVIAADVYFSADLWDRANSAVADALRAIPAQLPRLRASALLTKAKTALAEDDTPGAAAAISEIQGLSLDDPRLDAMVFALASEEAAARSDIAEAEKFMSASLGLFQDVTANSVPSLGAESIGLLEWHTHTFRRLEDHALTRHDLADAVRTSDAGRARLLFSKLSSEPAIGSQISKPADPVVVASRTSATIVMYASGPGRRPHLRVPLARAYVISPAGDINVRTLPDEENWDAWNLGSLAQLANEDERADLISIEFLSRLTELYAALIEPIEDLLPAPGSSVVIVPDNFTHMVPFAALSPAQGPSLLDRYVLSFAPSAAVLGALQARASRRRRSSGAAVIGSRAMGASRLAPHMKEVEQVARMYGTRPLLDIEPSAFSAAVSDVDVIHIAAHAALGGRYHYGYVPGALYLAGIGDDALTVKSVEIEELSVSARVVVLSACVSGLGHILPEGVIGLARAFLVAGASSIIASLWPVRTWSTAALMHDLHTQLSAGVAAAPALRNAMLACRDRYEDPIDWAPFALIGLN
jgi:CHAT domain-containing protein